MPTLPIPIQNEFGLGPSKLFGVNAGVVIFVHFPWQLHRSFLRLGTLPPHQQPQRSGATGLHGLELPWGQGGHRRGCARTNGMKGGEAGSFSLKSFLEEE